MTVRDGRRTDRLAVEANSHVEAAGHYLCVHVEREVHLLREPLASFAERMAPAGFVRVHRSALVRAGAVEAIVERRNGDADLRLAGGATVPMSRTYRAGLEAATRMGKPGS